MLLIGLAMVAAPFLVAAIVKSDWWPEDMETDVRHFGQWVDPALAICFFLGCGLAMAAIYLLFRRWARR
jgi:hypothetical protein